MKNKVIFASLTALFLMAVTAFAATLSGTVFGEATDLGGGSYKLTSDAAPGYGGVDYDVPADLKFQNINTLQTLQTPEADDTCIGGSPRFQLNVDTDGDGDSDGNVFVNTQSFTGGGCPADTGDLTGANGEVPGTYDLSQFIPGTQMSTYSAASAFFAANPTYTIVGIQIVVDSGWAFSDGEQTITVTPTVDVALPGPTDANSCKNGGWRLLGRPDGSGFKNQGDCIQYVNTGR